MRIKLLGAETFVLLAFALGGVGAVSAGNSSATAVAVAGTSGAAGSSTAKATSGLPFIQDDYEKALAQAKERKIPLFVNAWAEW